MLIWIIKYWVVIPAALITALISFGLHKIDMARIEAKQVKALAAQEAQLTAACQKAQKITEEISHDYQEQLSAFNRKLAALKRVRTNPQCVPIADAAARHDGAANTDKLSGPRGLRPDWLYDTAAEADQYRLQLIACQEFIKKERE